MEEKQWREEYLIKLVETVTKVEEKWRRNTTIHNTESSSATVAEEEKWEQVAAKMPFSALTELNYLGPTQYTNFPCICKRKFFEICEYFNDVFMKSHRNNCLTRALMNKLAEYSVGFPQQPFFSKTGSEAKYIKTDWKIEAAADSAGSARVACSSNCVRDCPRKLSRRYTQNSNQHDSLDFRNSGQREPTAQVHTPLRELQQGCLDNQYGSLLLGDARQHGPSTGPACRSESTAQTQAPSKHHQPRCFNEKHSELEYVKLVKKMSSPRDSVRLRDSVQRGSTAQVHTVPKPQQVYLDDQNGTLHSGHARLKESASQTHAPSKKHQQSGGNERNSELTQVEFVKKMSGSQVVRGFMLTLPADFCNANLAQHQLEKRVPFVLVDEDLVKWRVQYIPTGHRISGGWIAFVKKHRLEVDDILRFRLIKSQTFQVTITRKAESSTR